MEYHFKEIEHKWQLNWIKTRAYKPEKNSKKAKYYILDMFPYPSGAGLHVGHPLGYIASDILARYKRLNGYNVLHPMGFDSFGLPAEQYAIQTGQHPAITTGQNIKRYREQLDKMGFSFDWDREVRTSDPKYYRWTQWIFIQLFNSWYNPRKNKAESIDILMNIFETEGSEKIESECFSQADNSDPFTSDEWKSFDEKKRSTVLMHYRIAYLGEAFVNWCPAMGTVLANDEVKDGVSERGGYAVERKLMKQWSMRITTYAQRLLDGLEKIDWTESLKDAQKYWIGRSEGTSINFKIQDQVFSVEVFTTRPDTIFGVSFITLAPENELVVKITTDEYRTAVAEYVTKSKARSERERQAEVKNVSGVFTGAYAEHPFTGKAIPIWVGDYVLAGYGTGAVMAVPGHDSRDYSFARYFSLPIVEVVSGGDISKESYDAKEGILVHSDFLNGLEVKEAIKRAIAEIEVRNLGKGKINFRLRDAVFGRQRYWGEPIPVYYKGEIPYVLPESELPLILPEVNKFLPTESGEPPLARATDWKYQDKYEYEHTTMPGWAGSCWYYLRYMDPDNDKEFVSKGAVDYWQNIDLYLGGSEHATGHLLYVRFWTMFLHDRGYLDFEEPAKKLINQGMIQGVSEKMYRKKETSEIVNPNEGNLIDTNGRNSTLYSADYKLKPASLSEVYVPIEFVSNNILDIESFLISNQGQDYKNATFNCNGGYWRNGTFSRTAAAESDQFRTKSEVEKMSKSKWNVVSPDDICEKYGADCLRLYEMFLGPLEQSKPWNTNGISGVSNFLKKFWKLFHDDQFNFKISADIPVKAELKTLHKTIKKIQEDIERFSFNTSVSNFMICVNELTELKCNKREILEPLCILISPYAPHIAEELWSLIGHTEKITFAKFPEYKEEYLIADSYAYPISFNGKTRFKLELPISMGIPEIEREVLSSAEAIKYLEGKAPKKVIIVPKKIVNIVM
jgi:leucyl-tRNA synthetase